MFDVSRDGVVERGWSASDFGLSECHVDELVVNGAAESADRIRQILDGVPGASRDIVVANAAASLVAAGKAAEPAVGATLAATAIDSGQAKTVLERLATATNSMSASE